MSEFDSRDSHRPFMRQKVYGSGAHPWRRVGAAGREPLSATVRLPRGEPALRLWPRPADSRFWGFCAHPTPVFRRHACADRPVLPIPTCKSPNGPRPLPDRFPYTSRAPALGCTDLYGLCTVCVRFLYGTVRFFVGDCTVFWLASLRERTPCYG